MNIAKAFDNHPLEALLVAKLITGYTDLEIDLMNCIKELHQDLDMTFRKIYAIRGANNRIDKAKKLGEKGFDDLDLGDDFAWAIRGLNHCVKIRNQYAHCTFWNDNTKQLAFSNIETLAKTSEPITDLRGIDIKHLDISTLQQQINYYDYVSDLLIWILKEANSKRNLPFHPCVTKPQRLPEPALY